MADIDKSEQWLLEGKCHICKRKNCCIKKCFKYKQQKEIRSTIIKAVMKVFLTGG